MGIALVLALALNIDSIRLASSYVTHDALRETVIAKMPEIVENYKQLPSADEPVEGTQTSFKKALEDTREQIDFLGSAGFPVGWSHFPYGEPGGESQPDVFQMENSGRLLAWLLGIVLTAVLAGLGAPFWYDTVLSVSRVVETTRAKPKSSA
jgi:hypothetical protein